MARVKVEYLYPVLMFQSGFEEVDIPDNEDPESFLYREREALLEAFAKANLDEIYELGSALEVGYASLKIVDSETDRKVIPLRQRS